jgi:hypothetical protein
VRRRTRGGGGDQENGALSALRHVAYRAKEVRAAQATNGQDG